MADKSNNSLLLKAPVSNSFRQPLEYAESNALFVGRENEVAQLAEIVLNRKSATVLVSGPRGSGKTSFVRKAIQAARKRRSKIQFIVVEVPLFDEGSIGDSTATKTGARSKITHSLIRGLYYAIKNEGGKFESLGKLEEIYERTYVSELATKATQTNLLKQTYKQETSSKTEKSVTATLKLDSSALLGVLSIASSILAVGTVLALKEWLVTHQWVAFAILGLFVFATTGLGIKLTQKRAEAEKSVDGKTISEESGDTQSKTVDLSDDYFESELRSFLKDNSKTKFIFIYDELDKPPAVKPEVIISKLKNLFTLTNGVHAFITDDEYYQQIEIANREQVYGPQYTVFTDKIFLHQLTHNDLSQLFDALIEDVEYQESDSVTTKLKYYVGWKSQNHAFDFYKIIEKFIDYKTRKPTINVYDWTSLAYDQKSNVDRDWEAKAGLQVFVEAVYIDHRYPSSPYANAVLFTTLHLLTKTLVEIGSIRIEADDYTSLALSLFPKAQQDKLQSLLTEQELDAIGFALNDLLFRMEVYEDFVIPETDTEDLTTYTLGEVNFPEIGRVKDTNNLLPFEKEFDQEFNHLASIRSKFVNNGVTVKAEIESLFKNGRNSKILLNEPRRVRSKKTEIIDLTEKIQKQIQLLGDAELISVIEAAAAEFTNVEELNPTSAYPATGRRVYDHDTNFRPMYEEYKRSGFGNIKIYHNTEDLGLLLLIGFSIDNGFIDQFVKESRKLRGEPTTRIINIEFGNKNYRRASKSKYLRRIQVDEDFGNVTEVKRKLVSGIESLLGAKQS